LIHSVLSLLYVPCPILSVHPIRIPSPSLVPSSLVSHRRLRSGLDRLRVIIIRSIRINPIISDRPTTFLATLPEYRDGMANVSLSSREPIGIPAFRRRDSGDSGPFRPPRRPLSPTGPLAAPPRRFPAPTPCTPPVTLLRPSGGLLEAPPGSSRVASSRHPATLGHYSAHAV